jgi:hypothetical protein
VFSAKVPIPNVVDSPVPPTIVILCVALSAAEQY